jgi:hypothetical protein
MGFSCIYVSRRVIPYTSSKWHAISFSLLAFKLLPRNPEIRSREFCGMEMLDQARWRDNKVTDSKLTWTLRPKKQSVLFNLGKLCHILSLAVWNRTQRGSNSRI